MKSMFAKSARVAFGMAILLFAVFLLNVVVGGVLRQAPFLSDVAEMLTLFVAVTFFVLGTLALEAKERPVRLERDSAELP